MHRPAALAAAFALALALPRGARASSEPEPQPSRIPGQWVVLLRGARGGAAPLDDGADPLEGLAARLARAHGATVDHVWRHVLLGFRARGLSDAEARALAADDRVLGVYPDWHLSTPIFDCYEGTVAASSPPPADPQVLTCDDPSPENPAGVCVDNWGLDRIDQRDLPRDGLFHADGATGLGVHVYMIETGLYVDHDELRGRVGVSYNVFTQAPVTSDCPWSHGTHTAGIAAGTTYGVAKRATIHPVQIWSCTTGLQGSDIVSGLEWVYQTHGTAVSGPGVVNMSINAPPDVPLATAMGNLIRDRGVLVVESAGNQLADACSWTMPVPEAVFAGGADEFDTPWERSPGDPSYSAYCGADCGTNQGACVTLFAPAAHIVSAWGGATPTPNGICRLSGTSMAAPHVVGAAALYLEAHPAATPAEVKAALLAAATPGRLGQLAAGSPNLLLHVGVDGPDAGGLDGGAPFDAAPADAAAPEDAGAGEDARAPDLDAASTRDGEVVDAAERADAGGAAGEDAGEDAGGRDGAGSDATGAGPRTAAHVSVGAVGGGCACTAAEAEGAPRGAWGGGLALWAVLALFVRQMRPRAFTSR